MWCEEVGMKKCFIKRCEDGLIMWKKAKVIIELEM